MRQWAYLWRETYYKETGRTGDYVQWVTYQHSWKPDLVTEAPFPDQDGLDRLGKAGWELVTMIPRSEALLTRTSPQGDSNASYTSFLLMYKRQLEA
jgi:hypothetical protein